MTQEIILDEEFKFLLPQLDKETYALLEENILEHGVRDALVLWGDILVDGHNRYEICLAHGIEFATVQKEFASREEALIWIISTQVSRRNLTPIQLTHYRGVHYRADKSLRGIYYRKVAGEQIGQNVLFAQDTASRLAERYKVTPRTIRRDANVSAAIDAIGESSPEAKRMILSGELSISRAALTELSQAEGDEIAKIAESIAGGTFERKKTGASETATDESRDESRNRADAASFDAAISKLTEDFYSELRGFLKNDNYRGQKAALGAYIKTLQKLYRQM